MTRTRERWLFRCVGRDLTAEEAAGVWSLRYADQGSHEHELFQAALVLLVDAAMSILRADVSVSLAEWEKLSQVEREAFAQAREQLLFRAPVGPVVYQGIDPEMTGEKE